MGFSLLILALLVLVHLYVYKRAVHDVAGSRRGRIVGAVVLGILFVLVAVTFLTRRLFTSVALSYAGYLWFAVLLYLGLALLVGELVRVSVRVSPERRRFLSGVIAGVAGAAAVGTVTYGAIEARRPRVERRDVVLDRLDPAFDGFTIAAVSDIHLGPLVDGADLRGFVAAINAAGPDAVAVVGDLVDGEVAELGAQAEPLRDLTADTYFVTGNHEYYSGAAGWVEFLPTLGVRVLRNERVTLRRGAAVLHLAGCDDRTAAASGLPGHGFDLDKALAGRDPAEPVVLFCHQPVMVDQAARAGVDLQVSGHTHGGQLTPLTHVTLLDQPVLAGLTKVGPTWLYVTRGIGFWGPPVRVGSPPEITLLTLRAA
ncbi:metallophosphoesterase [Pseudonocardia pini]|uniref:metallophosphoesterase n=1 Tax=Pseudonocardia pini TaxID=2758030 RepID=UPI0015EFEA9E|nr:metallophosphoesterase [Pseudonocardia pini]